MGRAPNRGLDPAAAEPRADERDVGCIYVPAEIVISLNNAYNADGKRGTGRGRGDPGRADLNESAVFGKGVRVGIRGGSGGGMAGTQ